MKKYAFEGLLKHARPVSGMVRYVGFGALCVLMQGAVQARGVSPYLPLNLAPEIERQIERVLILADQSVMTRPIAAATVLDALPKACAVDAALCASVRRYLSRYMTSRAATQLSVAAGVAEKSMRPIPNQRGLASDSSWQASASGLVQPSDYLLFNLGVTGHEDEIDPTGSMLSVGFEYAQLDLGYRDHWWSPMTDSSMLLSTQAPTMLSATLSNYQPLTSLGVRYEMFAAKMSKTDSIAYQGGFTSGNPRLAGIRLTMEPVSGWALGAGRIMQFGGGARSRSLNDFFNAFFNPSRYDNTSAELTSDEEFGNQQVTFSSRALFPGRTPFAIYFEYAGEDGSRREAWRIGNASLSAGIDFPRLWEHFDLTYEVSDWQNGWYVHGVYGEGMSNEGHVLGHWGADHRRFGDGIGAQSHSLRLGWAPPFGGLMELRYRTLANESYSAERYEREHALTLRYSVPWERFTVGGELDIGQDAFGESYGRVGAFLRFDESASFGRGTDVGERDLNSEGTEIFVAAGINHMHFRYEPSDKGVTPLRNENTVGPHFGVGARRAVSSHSDLGARLELDEVDGVALLGVRAVDYRYRWSDSFAISAFVGAARYDQATAAYGYYGGLGGQWRNALPKIDINMDLRYTDKIARDVLLPQDPASSWGDVIYNIYGANLYLSYRFR